jgi:hypothetical protein
MQNVRLPKWMDDLPEAEKKAAIQHFYIRLAALYATPQGLVTGLSTLVGRHANYLSNLRVPSHGSLIRPREAVAIEKVCGRDLFPREMLCPEVFALPD